MNEDDPDLTAYALGELPAPKRSAVEAAIVGSPETKAYVEEVRDLAGLLRNEFAHEEGQAVKLPANIMPLPQEHGFWSDARWGSLAVAAVLAVAAIIGAVALSGVFFEPGVGKLGKRESILQMEVGDSPEPAVVERGQQAGDRVDANEFRSAATHPRSRFPLTVGSASYSRVQEQIEAGKLPARDEVQIEEMINRFSYDYPEPAPERPFVIVADAASCPWTPAHHLVRIAVKERESVRTSVADDVEVEFNPARVASYRLIGFENRMTTAVPPAPSDADARAANSGRVVTAMYEVVPVPSEDGSERLLTVTLAHRRANDAADVMAHMLTDAVGEFANAPVDFKFAAAVAEFAMILRDPTSRREGSIASVLALAEAGKGRDVAGERAEFIELVRKAEALLAGRG